MTSKDLLDSVRKTKLENMYDRLEWVLEKLDKNPNAASLEIGYRSRNGLREVLDRKKKREFTSTLLIRLYNTYKVSPNWLLLGIGEPFID